MRSHIDWLSFTMSPMYSGDDALDSSVDGYAMSLSRAILYTFGEDTANAVFAGEWSKQEKSRAPYTDAWKLGDNGISLYAHPELNHCTVEISGSGCERLIQTGLMQSVLLGCKARCTRLDLAIDIETFVTPREFVEQRSAKRSSSSGYQKSNTGETCYVGSQKSERYARVYRYAEPHPRAHLLRAEHVFRRDYAKVVSNAIYANGIEKIAPIVAKHFGWSHPVFDMEKTDDIDLTIPNAERNGGKTLFWMLHSVVPAFRRLVADGTISDPEKFINRYFLNAE